MTGVITDDKSINSNICCTPLSTNTISDIQFLEGIRTIFNMAKNALYETRYEAVKMLCDLSQHSHQDHLMLPSCVQECVSCLESLIRDSFDEIRQHAIIAFSIFCEIPGYQTEMVRSEILPIILCLADNPMSPIHETIQMRRECTKILVILTNFDCYGVLECLHTKGSSVRDWIDKVESFEDQRLKMNAIRAKDNFQRAFLSCKKC